MALVIGSGIEPSVVNVRCADGVPRLRCGVSLVLSPTGGGSADPLGHVAVMFDDLADQLRAVGTGSAIEALIDVSVRRIRGADAASVTTLESGRFTTVAASDDRARRADAIQYELGSGPCVDAILEQPLCGRR